VVCGPAFSGTKGEAPGDAARFCALAPLLHQAGAASAPVQFPGAACVDMGESTGFLDDRVNGQGLFKGCGCKQPKKLGGAPASGNFPVLVLNGPMCGGTAILEAPFPQPPGALGRA